MKLRNRKCGLETKLYSVIVNKIKDIGRNSGCDSSTDGGYQ